MKSTRYIAAASVIMLSVFFLFQLNAGGDVLYSQVAEYEKAIGVSIIYKSKYPDTWGSANYELCTDPKELLAYLEIAKREFSKYPPGYLKKACVDRLVLGKDFAYHKQARAAMPDPYRRSLYLSINGAYGSQNEVYLVHVMHHELHHCTEYAIWGGMNYVWPEWEKLNKANFRYGSGGASAYDNLKINWYAMENPVPGFINHYSTTAQEEDRSEIMACLMSDIERNILHKYCATDPILKAKSKKLIELLNQFYGGKGQNYWESQNEEKK